MLMQHRPWAIGYKAQYRHEHEEGAVEGWIGHESSSIVAPDRAQPQWSAIRLVPCFVSSDACLRMTYNGEALEPYPLYSQPFLKSVTIVASHNELGVALGAMLGQKNFDSQQTDMIIDIIERDGLYTINNQENVVSIALGGSWGANPTPQVGVPLAQVGLAGVKHAALRIKPIPVSLSDWIRQGGLRIHAHGKTWVSSDIEIGQMPLGRVRWVELF